MNALRIVTTLAVLAAGAGLVIALAVYLPEHAGGLVLGAGSAAAAAMGAAVWLVPRSVRRRIVARGIHTVLLAALMALPLSTWVPGGISCARFGLTVVGACPILLFDITIRADGALRFRRKSHRITLEEIRPLLEPGLDLLIIANGWQSAARVDPGVLTLGVAVEVLPTPESFDRYNLLRRLGKRVALLAHTTC